MQLPSQTNSLFHHHLLLQALHQQCVLHGHRRKRGQSLVEFSFRVVRFDFDWEERVNQTDHPALTSEQRSNQPFVPPSAFHILRDRCTVKLPGHLLYRHPHTKRFPNSFVDRTIHQREKQPTGVIGKLNRDLVSPHVLNTEFGIHQRDDRPLCASRLDGVVSQSLQSFIKRLPHL